jgi:hypothetical protein
VGAGWWRWSSCGVAWWSSSRSAAVIFVQCRMAVFAWSCVAAVLCGGRLCAALRGVHLCVALHRRRLHTALRRCRLHAVSRGCRLHMALHGCCLRAALCGGIFASPGGCRRAAVVFTCRHTAVVFVSLLLTGHCHLRRRGHCRCPVAEGQRHIPSRAPANAGRKRATAMPLCQHEPCSHMNGGAQKGAAAVQRRGVKGAAALPLRDSGANPVCAQMGGRAQKGGGGLG